MFPLDRAIFRGKSPWVDQSCADCPGFPVLGAGDAPSSRAHPGASEYGGVSQVNAALSAIVRYTGVQQLHCRKSRLSGSLCDSLESTYIIRYLLTVWAVVFRKPYSRKAGLLQGSTHETCTLAKVIICLLSRKLLWSLSSSLPGDLELKNCRGDFWWIFSGLPGNEARKVLKDSGKIRSKIRGKICDRNIRRTFILTTPKKKPGEGSTVQWRWSPPFPGSLKALLFPPPSNKKYKGRGRQGCERGTTRNFLQSFPLSSTPVVQSYWSPILQLVWSNKKYFSSGFSSTILAKIVTK